MNLADALQTLDPADANQWTADGQPRMDVLYELMGRNDFTRKDVIKANPTFTRQTSDEAPEKQTTEVAASEAAGLPNPIAPGFVKAVQAVDPFEADTLGDEPDINPATDEAPEASEPAEDGAPVANSQPAMEPVIKAHPLMINPNQAQLDVLMAECKIATEDMVAKQAIAKAGATVAQAAADVVNILNGKIELMEQRDPHHHARGVRAVIAQSNKARAERAARMAAFTAKVGVSPQQAALTLNAKSPIDQAMSGRKRPRPLNTGRAGAA